ncbi:TPA: hypothetical protein UM349_000062 [Stenotrophomonas maltophilia]|nr:hypothetical protein [Stenotrophomonas maltophilia]
MSRYTLFAELAEFNMGLTACAVFLALVLGGAIVSIVIAVCGITERIAPMAG